MIFSQVRMRKRRYVKPLLTNPPIHGIERLQQNDGRGDSSSVTYRTLQRSEQQQRQDYIRTWWVHEYNGMKMRENGYHASRLKRKSFS